MLTGKGSLRLEVPRDRNGSFEPQFVAKRQTRLPGFDEEVISLYARGLTPARHSGPPAATLPGIGLSGPDQPVSPTR